MTIIITLFYLSLLVVVAMIVKKFLEIRTLKLSLVEGIEQEISRKAHHFIQIFWYDWCLVLISRTHAGVVRGWYVLEHAVLGLIIRLSERLKRRHHKLYDMVKGKGVLKNKGSVSTFLKEVSTYKEEEKSSK